MSKKLIWLPAFALALLFGQPSYACPAEKNPSIHCHCNDSTISSSKLNLTDAQKVKIKNLKIQARTNLKANHKQLKVFNQQINALILVEKLDEAKLDNLINQKNKIQGVILKNRIMLKQQIYSLLTDKQKQQYQQMMKQKEQKHS